MPGCRPPGGSSACHGVGMCHASPRKLVLGPSFKVKCKSRTNRETSLWPLNCEGDGDGLAGAARALQLVGAEIAHTF